MKVFYNDWESLEEMKSDFRISDEDLLGVKILFASYTLQYYEGYATVLFEKDGKLFEVIGSHCSCYGLEGQWEPTETYIEAIEKMATGEIWIDGDCKQAMIEVLKYLQDKQDEALTQLITETKKMNEGTISVEDAFKALKENRKETK